MLRTVFIGSESGFNNVIVDWLSKNSELSGVVWTDAVAWRKSPREIVKFARSRMRRYGILKTFDEVLFFVWYHTFVARRDNRQVVSKILEPYWAHGSRATWSGPVLRVRDINCPESLRFVEAARPDMVCAMCINTYFERDLRAIPRHGVFLWHEGITPEYRGLYPPFWALHNCDFERVGCTFLRMNDKYDAGEVFVQTSTAATDPFTAGHAYIGHKAVFDSLPEVGHFLRRLEAGDARPLLRTGSFDRYYTYPGFSDLVRQRFRLRRWLREAGLRSRREANQIIETGRVAHANECAASGLERLISSPVSDAEHTAVGQRT